MLAALALVGAASALTGADYVLVREGGVDGQIFDGLNQAHGTDKLSLYNSSWGTSINPNAFNILVRINDDRIVLVRSYGSTGSVLIPTDSWVIAANGVKLPVLSGFASNDGAWVRPTDTCRGSGVPVLVYHDLGTTDTNFEATLQAIQADGYTTITLVQLENWMTGADTLPANPILLTFDDAYDSHFAFGAQLLNEYDMHGLFFVIGTRPGTTSAWATWAEINTGLTTYPDNVELGCHSYDAHTQPGGVDKYLTMTEAERINDLALCKSTIASHTGVTPTSIAWPFGGYDEALVTLAEDAGFTMIFTTLEGLNHPRNADAMGHIRRFGTSVDNPWSTAQTLMAKWHVCD